MSQPEETYQTPDPPSPCICCKGPRVSMGKDRRKCFPCDMGLCDCKKRGQK